MAVKPGRFRRNTKTGRTALTVVPSAVTGVGSQAKSSTQNNEFQLLNGPAERAAPFRRRGPRRHTPAESRNCVRPDGSDGTRGG
ncbi:hypothetical protein GCM10010381_57550 [Streptomyces xantholiticus]|nr:hypothetical protein GCM10010381_57550 [Streptomyces xantholiticus]